MSVDARRRTRPGVHVRLRNGRRTHAEVGGARSRGRLHRGLALSRCDVGSPRNASSAVSALRYLCRWCDEESRRRCGVAGVAPTPGRALASTERTAYAACGRGRSVDTAPRSRLSGGSAASVSALLAPSRRCYVSSWRRPRVHQIVIPNIFGIRNLRLQLSPSGVHGLDTAAACSPFSRLVSLGCAQGCGWASLDRRSQPEDAPCRSRRPARRRHSKASTSLCVHPQV